MNRCEQAECDKRYVMRVWLYGTTVVACLGIVGVCYAAGVWKAQTDSRIQEIISTATTTTHKLDMLETRLLPKVDSLLQWTRQQ